MADSGKLIERAYKHIGPIYNFIWGKLLFNEGREAAIELMEPKKGFKILEVGVGTGLALPLYPADCTVVGVDLSESMLKEAEVLIKERRLKNCSVKLMDATKLEFSDNEFDAVLGNLFISATTFPLKALNEMKRVCKKDGTLVLMNHFRSENPVVGALESAFNPIAQRLGFKSDLEMRPLLKEAGLTPEKVRKVNMLNLWTAVSMRNKK